MITKKCKGCQEVKPVDDYYVDRHSSFDGYFHKCKECVKKRSIKYRWLNIEKVRKYDRDRGSRNAPGYNTEYSKKFPLKRKAHGIVQRAVRNGLITKKPCEICGNEKSGAHHDDYAKVMEVRWLCQAHHMQWHRDNGPGLNGGD